MKPYVVKQGDHLKKLAFKMGFDPDEVWNDGSNSDLKKLRKTGDILKPGDILMVPDPERVKNSYSVGGSNPYKAKLPKVTVKVALKGPGGKPLANESYIVKGIGQDDKELTTDGDGNVTFDAGIDIGRVELQLTKRKKSFQLLVGGLNPISEASGLKMRLEHLGFYSPTFEGGDDSFASRDDALLAAAVSAFQLATGIDATGVLDDATSSALIDKHGS